MGVCFYYQNVPGALLERLSRSPGLLSVFTAFGATTSFDELDAEDIEEIAGGHPPEIVQELRALMSSLPELPDACIEKTHGLHETMFERGFADAGAPNPRELTQIVVYGEETWGDNDFWVVAPKRCVDLAEWMRRFAVDKVVGALDLDDAWHDRLVHEFSGLLECYRHAAEHRYHVLIGAG